MPGGPTSDPGDALPGLDGRTKAKFSFAASYRDPEASAPMGRFTFTHGSRFPLRADGFDWLLHEGPGRALMHGKATIEGMEGSFTFRVSLIDGDVGGGADRLALRVFGPGSDPGFDQPLYRASGDAGGQIRVGT